MSAPKVAFAQLDQAFAAPDYGVDHASLRREIDRLPIEELLEAFIRRSERARDLARAAWHQAELETDAGRLEDLRRRCESSALICRSISSAMHAMAPRSEQDERAFNIALDVAAIAAVVIPRVGNA